MDSPNKTARIAGALYLLIVFCGIFYLRYIPSKLIVHGDGAATISNILASETLFRLGILAELTGGVLFILLPLALYKLFRGVNKAAALLMVIFIMISLPVSIVNVQHKLDVLALLHKDDYLNVFSPGELQAQVLLHLRYYNIGNEVQELFWGLWLLPFGYLAFKCGFLPRILGILLMLGCFGYVADFVVGLVYPPYNETNIGRYITLPASIGELLTCLWMLVMGAKYKVRKM
jgi:hypothetical protein